MVVRAADPHRRADERVEPVCHQPGEVIADQRVGRERHVRTVLLGRPEGDDEPIAPCLLLGLHLRPGHPIKLERAHTDLH